MRNNEPRTSILVCFDKLHKKWPMTIVCITLAMLGLRFTMRKIQDMARFWLLALVALFISRPVETVANAVSKTQADELENTVENMWDNIHEERTVSQGLKQQTHTTTSCLDLIDSDQYKIYLEASQFSTLANLASNMESREDELITNASVNRHAHETASNGDWVLQTQNEKQLDFCKKDSVDVLYTVKFRKDLTALTQQAHVIEKETIPDSNTYFQRSVTAYIKTHPETAK